MNKIDLLTKYINYAIKNGYKNNNIEKIFSIIENIHIFDENEYGVNIDTNIYGTYLSSGCVDVGCDTFNVYEILNSNSFIEAISNGLIKNTEEGLLFLGDRDGIEYKFIGKDIIKLYDFIFIEQNFALKDNDFSLYINRLGI